MKYKSKSHQITYEIFFLLLWPVNLAKWDYQTCGSFLQVQYVLVCVQWLSVCWSWRIVHAKAPTTSRTFYAFLCLFLPSWPTYQNTWVDFKATRYRCSVHSPVWIAATSHLHRYCCTRIKISCYCLTCKSCNFWHAVETNYKLVYGSIILRSVWLVLCFALCCFKKAACYLNLYYLIW